MKAKAKSIASHLYIFDDFDGQLSGLVSIELGVERIAHRRPFFAGLPRLLLLPLGLSVAAVFEFGLLGLAFFLPGFVIFFTWGTSSPPRMAPGVG
jgi:hypothetical protein